MTAFDDPASRSFARIAGSLYLLIGFAGVFSILWVPAQLTVSGDPFGTAALIAQRPGLFAAGVGGDVVVMLAEVMLSVMLYAMFVEYVARHIFANMFRVRLCAGLPATP